MEHTITVTMGLHTASSYVLQTTLPRPPILLTELRGSFSDWPTLFLVVLDQSCRGAGAHSPSTHSQFSRANLFSWPFWNWTGNLGTEHLWNRHDDFCQHVNLCKLANMLTSLRQKLFVHPCRFASLFTRLFSWSIFVSFSWNVICWQIRLMRRESWLVKREPINYIVCIARADSSQHGNSNFSSAKKVGTFSKTNCYPRCILCDTVVINVFPLN